MSISETKLSVYAVDSERTVETLPVARRKSPPPERVELLHRVAWFARPGTSAVPGSLRDWALTIAFHAAADLRCTVHQLAIEGPRVELLVDVDPRVAVADLVDHLKNALADALNRGVTMQGRVGWLDTFSARSVEAGRGGALHGE